MQSRDAIVVNYYGPMQVKVTSPEGNDLTLNLVTDYPLSELIQIQVGVSAATTLAIRLRIPTWSQTTTVSINGEPQTSAQPGTYFEMRRRWQPGDVIALRLDFNTRVNPGQRNATGLSAVYRGPILLAYDERFGSVSALTPPTPDFSAPPRVATNVQDVALVATFPSSGGDVSLCDFASAGQSSAGRLFGRPNENGTWQFSRSDNTVLAERMQLHADGSITGYAHPNEARWGYDDECLVFYGSNGLISTRFTLRAMQNGLQVLSGPSLFDPKVRHTLQQISPDILGKAWQFWRIGPDGATILRSTLRLLPEGGFDRPTHANETRWRMEGSTLVFYAINGSVSTRFTSIRVQHGRMQYSGNFLFDQAITHILSEADLDFTHMIWRFIRRQAGQTDVTLADKVRLLPNQKIDGYWHPNETSWAWGNAGDSIVFRNANSAVTTAFTAFHARGGVMRLEGQPLFDLSITHILEESAPGWKMDADYVSWVPS